MRENFSKIQSSVPKVFPKVNPQTAESGCLGFGEWGSSPDIVLSIGLATGSRLDWRGTQTAANFHLYYPGTKRISIIILRDSSTAESLLKMAPIMKKRPRTDANFGSRKRPKHDQNVAGPSHNLSTQPLSLDTLPWQEVALPKSGFEDAEGFFGLEEISDVEVVKDPKLGKVEYRVCQLPLNSTYQTTNSAVQISYDISRSKPQGISNHAARASHTKNTTAQRVTAEDDQWEGFEELDQAEGKDTKRAPEMTNVERAARNIKLKPKERQKNERKDVIPKQAPSKVSANPFDALAAIDDNKDVTADETDGERVGISIDDGAY